MLAQQMMSQRTLRSQNKNGPGEEAASAVKKDALTDALDKTLARITSGKVACLQSTIERSEGGLKKRNRNDTEAPRR